MPDAWRVLTALSGRGHEPRAETTRRDRPTYLRAGGPLLGPLGSVPLDEITAQTLRAWWTEQIEGPGRSVGTGRHYLDVLSAVLGYAVDLGILGANPVPTFREMLRRMMRNKRGRALADPSGRKRPLERPEEIDALVQAAAAEGASELVLVLLGVDAGLRYGEMLGVRWGLVSWGSRSLHLDETSNRPRGWNPTEPKSGRIRDVALSRRLLAALSDLYEVRFHPSPDALILDGTDASNFRKRQWRRICARRPRAPEHQGPARHVCLAAPHGRHLDRVHQPPARTRWDADHIGALCEVAERRLRGADDA
ncbi:MAG TPA: tyrosine-type recombinase/integrase [Myxococcota bacterium]|nr:tyrosine-type recombinase/integrase [Myxococcota bacterium]